MQKFHQAFVYTDAHTVWAIMSLCVFVFILVALKKENNDPIR